MTHQNAIFLLLLLIFLGGIFTFKTVTQEVKPTINQPLVIQQIVKTSIDSPGTLELGILNNEEFSIVAKARIYACASRDTLYYDIPFESAPILIKPGRSEHFFADIAVTEEFPEGLYTCSLLISNGKETIHTGEFFLVVE